MASLKQMAALFTAYDRMTYQKLIPRHLAELLRAPQEILSCLQKGGFAVSLSGVLSVDIAYPIHARMLEAIQLLDN